MTRAVRSLDAEHVTVLDGRTLNLCVPLPEGSTAAWLRAGDRTLRLELDGTRAYGTYTVEPVARESGRGRRWAGRRRRGDAGTVTVPEGEPRELIVEVAAGGRRRTAYGLRASDTATRRAMAAGPTRPDPPHPDGWRLTIAPAAEGHAALHAERLPPSAEVDRVELGWTELAVHGRAVGLPGRGDAVELALRGRPGAVHELRTTWDGATGFTAVAGGGELARSAGRGGERIWDVRMRVAGGRVPVGRLLGDVTDPGHVHRLPNRLLVAGSGDVVRVAPYYTRTGRLVVVTAPVGGRR